MKLKLTYAISVIRCTIMKLISRWKQLLFLLQFGIICWLIYLKFDTKEINLQFFYETNPVSTWNPNFTLTPPLKCEGEDHFLVILVATRPNEVKARRAIRVTWGQKRTWLGKNVLTLFLIGKDGERWKPGKQSIEEESVQYGDIISQNFIESYNNLTLKTIMGFQWISEFCPNAEYVMKVDSDVFVNVKYLVHFLLKTNKTISEFFTGFPFINTKPHRGFFTKAYISSTDYPFSVYPPYCSGLGYVFSGELSLKIYEMMGHVKPVKFEDVFVGICLKMLGVKLHILEKELFFIQKPKFDKCLYSRLIAVHGVSPWQLTNYWEDLRGLEISSC